MRVLVFFYFTIMRSGLKSARTFIVHRFLKGVEEFRSDASLRSVDVCLTRKSVPPFCKGRLGGDSESLIAHRSSFNVHRSSFNVHPSSFIIHRSSFNVNRSSLNAHRSSPQYSYRANAERCGISQPRRLAHVSLCLCG